MSSPPTIECPICRENKSTFVTLECQHKICLKCYHNCIYHNHTKCSLCRKNIPELVETCELIKDIEQDVESLEKNIDKLNDKIYKQIQEITSQDTQILEHIEELDNVNGAMEDLQDKHDMLWAQIN